MIKISPRHVLSIGTVIGLILLGFIANQIWIMELRSPNSKSDPMIFEVREGESFSTIAEHLQNQDFIPSAFWFRVAKKMKGASLAIQPGMYTLFKGMNYDDILYALYTPGSAEITVTIPEGLNIKQMGEIYQTKLGISAADWAAATGVKSPFEQHSFVLAAQKPDSVDLEGYLFPDTYRFFKTATAEDVVKKMIDTMALKYADAVKDNENTEAKKLGFTPHDYLVLASIVEKEVRLPTTMKVVSGIFMNRLSINMALQVDSSVNYITGGDDPSVSYADLQIDSPYNTYKYRGLPPGPISAPGSNALFAVFHPTETDYMYFLTTDAGDVRYSKTLEQHNEYKAIYLR